MYWDSMHSYAACQSKKNPNELDVGKLVGAVGALGMGLFTIIGTIIALFAKGKENAELRENNDALRAAGRRSMEYRRVRFLSTLLS